MLIEGKNLFLRWKGVKSNLAGIENDQGAISDVFYPLDISVFTDRVRAGNNFLTIAEIWPTAFCDSKCNFCSGDIYGIKSKSRLTAAKLKEIISSLSDLGVNLVRFSGGGEPFLIKNLAEIIEFTAKKNLLSLYITNGLALKVKDINALAKHANLVRFSLNAGTPEDYLKVSGVDCFKKVLANAKLIVKARKREHREKEMYLGVNFIVTPDNFRGLSAAAKIAKSLGFDFILFRKFNPPKQRFFGQDLEILKNEVNKSLALADKNFTVRCLFENVSGLRGPKKLYSRCFAADFRLFIDARGDVYPCFSAAQSRKDALGNVYKNSLEKIWDSEPARELRKKLNRGELADYCHNFCDRVEFNSFVDWTKSCLDKNKDVKFKKIPKASESADNFGWF